MTCSYCTTAVHLTNKVPNQLSLVQAYKNNHLGKPLCIETETCKNYNSVLHTQDHDPDLSTLKLHENLVQLLVALVAMAAGSTSHPSKALAPEESFSHRLNTDTIEPESDISNTYNIKPQVSSHISDEDDCLILFRIMLLLPMP